MIHDREQSVSAWNLRVFSVLQLLFWLFIGTALLKRGWSMPWVGGLWMAAAGGGLLGLLSPKHIKSYHRTWMALAQPFGNLVSYCLLALVYFGIVTPIAIWRRGLGADPLQLRPDSKASTYWNERKAAPPVDRYFRQF